jgi:alkylhydroperoxidase family enzyme
MPAQQDSPKPITREVLSAGDAEAFIPYPDVGENLEHVPINVRPDLYYYISRMGFLPHTLRLYLHTPWAAEYLFRLNNAVMRDERGSLTEHFKYRLSFVASRDNECTYCTAHIGNILEKRWQYDGAGMEQVLRLEDAADEREAVAFEFVHQATLDPVGVSDDLRARLAAHYTPQEVMEIVLVVGFWKMYNTMHSAMAAPLEDPVLDYCELVNVAPAVAVGQVAPR